VRRNGVEIKRESLGTSVYRGGVRILAKNPADLGRASAPAASDPPAPDEEQPDTSG